MRQRNIRSDGTLYAHEYLQILVQNATIDPLERRRRLTLLSAELRRHVRGLLLSPVPEFWALRVRGPSEALNQLAEYLQQKPGIQFERENPPLTGSTDA